MSTSRKPSLSGMIYNGGSRENFKEGETVSGTERGYQLLCIHKTRFIPAAKPTQEKTENRGDTSLPILAVKYMVMYAYKMHNFSLLPILLSKEHYYFSK